MTEIQLLAARSIAWEIIKLVLDLFVVWSALMYWETVKEKARKETNRDPITRRP